jgi:hypothetical protein
MSQPQESMTSVDATENNPFLLSQDSVLTTNATDDVTKNIDQNLSIQNVEIDANHTPQNVGYLKTNNSSFLSQESVLTVDNTNETDNIMDPYNTPQIVEHLKTKRKRDLERTIFENDSTNSDNRIVIIPYDEFLSFMGNFVCVYCQGTKKVSFERLTWDI